MITELAKLNDEVSRRKAMQGIAAMTLGLNAALPSADAALAPTNKRKVVRIFLPGGMSHMDSFDPKPQTPEMMGNTKVIKTNTGEEISSYFPNMARNMDKVALIRSMQSPDADHYLARYIMETSYRALGTIKHPSFGAWMQRMNGVQNKTLPPTVNIRSKFGAGYLGTSYDPFVVNSAKDALKGLIMDDPKSDKNMRFLKLMADVRRDFHKDYQFKGVEDYRQYYNDSIKLMHSKDLEAFDLGKEDKATAKKFEITHGDNFLLTRRLLQVGVQYISMNIGGWDDHNDLWDEENYPKKAKDLDKALATFLEDLDAHGLLDETIVTVNSEFGRTPKISARKGRDHYHKAFFGIMAGAGVKGGVVYGKTNDQSTKVIENPVTPPDFNATLATLVGIDINKEIYSPDNRPFTISRGGKPIKEIMV